MSTAITMKAYDSSGRATLGMISRKMMRKFLAPIERAESTNSRCAKTNVLARDNRVIVGMLTMAKPTPTLTMASPIVFGSTRAR